MFIVAKKNNQKVAFFFSEKWKGERERDKWYHLICTQKNDIDQSLSKYFNLETMVRQQGFSLLYSKLDNDAGKCENSSVRQTVDLDDWLSFHSLSFPMRRQMIYLFIIASVLFWPQEIDVLFSLSLVVWISSLVVLFLSLLTFVARTRSSDVQTRTLCETRGTVTDKNAASVFVFFWRIRRVIRQKVARREKVLFSFSRLFFSLLRSPMFVCNRKKPPPLQQLRS